jgi:aflatoxin B1 aldehyde reductase
MTKAPSCLVPGGSTKDGIIEQWKASENALKSKHIAIYLLHVPDDETPISETMEGIQALYLAGYFTQVCPPCLIFVLH